METYVGMGVEASALGGCAVGKWPFDVACH